jgi:selenium-binding protein 1
MISMLGDSEGNAPGGFLLLDENFDIVGRWERQAKGMKFNYRTSI